MSLLIIRGNMSIGESPVNRFLSKYGLIVLIALLTGAFWISHLIAPAQPASEQKSLVDIKTIETLRAQFNRDIGQTRLIILVSPT